MTIQLNKHNKSTIDIHINSNKLIINYNSKLYPLYFINEIVLLCKNVKTATTLNSSISNINISSFTLSNGITLYLKYKINDILLINPIYYNYLKSNYITSKQMSGMIEEDLDKEYIVYGIEGNNILVKQKNNTNNIYSLNYIRFIKK